MDMSMPITLRNYYYKKNFQIFAQKNKIFESYFYTKLSINLLLILDIKYNSIYDTESKNT